MSEAPVVRPARSRELDRLAALYTLLIEHHRGAPRFAPARDAATPARRHLAECLEDVDVRVLVAEDANGLCGFCIARVLRRPPIYAETVRGEIDALFVREEARRGGAGRALVAGACSWLRGAAERVDVQVAAGNVEGRAFWTALGFSASMDVLERPL